MDFKKKQTMVGEVVSDKMEKTVVVRVTRKIPHPVYKTNIGRKFTIQETDEFDAIISTGLAERNSGSFKDISKDKYLLNGSRKPLLAIQSFIEQHLKEFCFSPEILEVNENKISCKITQAWLNVYETQASNPVHTHKNSCLLIQ